MSEPGFVDLQSWLAALSRTSVLIELGALAGCVLLAWLLARLVSKAFVEREFNSIMFGRRIVDGVLFPALLLCLAYGARKLLAYNMPLALFKLAIPVLMSLLVIRLGVKVLQAAFSDTPAVRLLERTAGVSLNAACSTLTPRRITSRDISTGIASLNNASGML